MTFARTVSYADGLALSKYPRPAIEKPMPALTFMRCTLCEKREFVAPPSPTLEVTTQYSITQWSPPPDELDAISAPFERKPRTVAYALVRPMNGTDSRSGFARSPLYTIGAIAVP